MALAEGTEALPDISIDVAKERTKPRLVSLLFFDFSNVTVERKFNLLGVFDRISLPSDKRDVSFGFFMRAANVLEGPLDLLIYGPDNVLAASLTMSPDVEDAKEKGHTQLQAVGQISVEFKDAGHFWFGVTYQGEVIGSARLMVEFQPEEKKDEHVSGRAEPTEASPE